MTVVLHHSAAACTIWLLLPTPLEGTHPGTRSQGRSEVARGALATQELRRGPALCRQQGGSRRALSLGGGGPGPRHHRRRHVGAGSQLCHR